MTPEDKDMDITTTEAQSTPLPPGTSDRIAELRARIDEIDAQLIELWLERAAISKEVGATRMAAGGTRLVLSREQEILARFRDALGPEGTELAMLILRAGRGPLL